jgi:hypothetical protein
VLASLFSPSRALISWVISEPPREPESLRRSRCALTSTTPKSNAVVSPIACKDNLIILNFLLILNKVIGGVENKVNYVYTKLRIIFF